MKTLYTSRNLMILTGIFLTLQLVSQTYSSGARQIGEIFKNDFLVIDHIGGSKTTNLKPQFDNGFLLVQEMEESWDYYGSQWDNTYKYTLTYDPSDNLIVRFEELLDTNYNWVNNGKEIYLYENNNLAEKLHQRWDTTHWENIDKQNFFYDENNNLIEERHYAWWVDNEWHNSDKFFHSYDVNNNLVQTTKQNYWNGFNWENEEKHTYTYDGNNNVVESVRQDWDGSGWVNYWKSIYFYDENNNAYEILWQSWYDSEWINWVKYLSTFDENSNLIKVLNQNWDWDISDWVDNHKWTYTFDENNNQIKILSQDWFDDSYWLNQRKNTYYYRPAGSEQFVASRTDLDKPIDDFQTTEDNIIIESGKEDKILIGVEVLIDEVLHTSDSDLEFTLSHNGISEAIICHAGGSGENFIGTKLTDNSIDSVSTGTVPFVGNYKPENSLSPFVETEPEGNWTLSIYDGVEGNTGTLNAWGLVLIYDSNTGVDDRLLFESDISVYPNPAVSIVNLQLPQKDFGPSQQTAVVKIYDLNGRKLFQKQIPKGNEEVKIDVTGLKNGIYFCKVNICEFATTKKLIIQK